MLFDNCHMLVDIETLGLGPQAHIIALGYVVFKVYDNGSLFVEHQAEFAIDDTDKQNSTIDVSTVRWWMAPEQAPARDVLLHLVQKSSLSNAFRQMRRAWNDHSCRHVWARGPQFDMTIINHHISREWEFDSYIWRDTRSVIDVCLSKEEQREVRESSVFTKHTPIGDCMTELLLFERATKKLWLSPASSHS